MDVDGWIALQFREHELGQTLADSEGQGGLVCCSPWNCKESDTTGRLNNNNKSVQVISLRQLPISLSKSEPDICLHSNVTKKMTF